jgi:hypothetical protein
MRVGGLIKAIKRLRQAKGVIFHLTTTTTTTCTSFAHGKKHLATGGG